MYLTESVVRASRMSKAGLARDLRNAGVAASISWEHDELVSSWLQHFGTLQATAHADAMLARWERQGVPTATGVY